MTLTIDTTPEQDATLLALVDTFPDADAYIDFVTTTDEGDIYVRFTGGGFRTEPHVIFSRTIDADGSFYWHEGLAVRPDDFLDNPLFECWSEDGHDYMRAASIRERKD